MANNEIFILFGTKFDKIYYIANTNPIIWTSNIKEAKAFYTRYSAEYTILRDYDNYHFIKRQLNISSIDKFYLSKNDINSNEIERYQLL